MSNFKLLDHQIKRFGAVTVMDVLLRDVVTQEPVLFLDTLKVSSISMESSNKEITGGIGAQLLIDYDYARRVNFTMQDALASLESLSVMWGAELKTLTSSDVLTRTFNAEVDSNGAITVTGGVPAATWTNIYLSNGTELEWSTDEPAGLKAKEGSIDAGSYKLFADVPVSGTDAARLVIDAAKFPETLELIGDTYFINQASGKREAYQIRIPMLKTNIGGELTLEAEGDSAVFDFSGKAIFSTESREYFSLVRVGEEYESTEG